MITKTRIKDPKFLLIFPPLQFHKDEMIRPNGSWGLSIPYLHASLKQANFEVNLLDICVGNEKHKLEDSFYNKTPLTDEIVRIGLSPGKILEEVQDYDVIGITSNFTEQTSRCFEVGKLIKANFPDKILISGGINARNLKEHFLNNGFDMVFLSEGEKAIVEFANFLHTGKPAVSEIKGVSYRLDNEIITNPLIEVDKELDSIPMPSWEALPNEKYWKINRIWGGKAGWIDGDETVKYATIMTTRGCVFNCSYCHISKDKSENFGKVGRMRFHSIERVDEELKKVKELGINLLFVNDESFLVNRKRVFKILELLKNYNFKIADINGVNISHLFIPHNGKYTIDEDLLQALHENGFRKLSLSFESGTQRILDRYCSGKWQIQKHNVVELVKKTNEIGIAIDGAFMIGWPDETLEELTNTYLLARRLMDNGLDGCAFFMVQPFPGCALHDESIRNDQLSSSLDYDKMGWSKGSIFNHLKIDKNILKYTWSLVWKLLNPEVRVNELEKQLAGKN